MIRVGLRAAGVCHSDFHVIKGDWPQHTIPTILGHEGAGVVEEVGDHVRGINEGDHVILSWKRQCGHCEMCQKGFPNLCDLPPYELGLPRTKSGETMNKFVGMGTFSTSTLVPHDAIVRIDKDFPFAQAALIWVRRHDGSRSGHHTAKVEPGSSVAIFGCGGVGLNCIQGAVLASAEPIIAVDIRDNKLEMARQFGATHTINASQEDPVERIQEISGGPGVHYAFEAIGLTGEPFIQSIECTRKRGVTVFVGHAPVNTPLAMDARMLLQEKSIIGCYYGSARTHVDFHRLIGLYRAEKLRLDELVSRTYPLEGGK